MEPECLGKKFGHSYLPNGICSNCRGFQNPLRGMERIELPKKINKSGSARAFLVSQFLEELNKDRDGVRFKKLTPQALGVKLAHLKLEDLRWFWDECHQEDKMTKKKIFNSKKFWWKLKNEI